MFLVKVLVGRDDYVFTVNHSEQVINAVEGIWNAELRDDTKAEIRTLLAARTMIIYRSLECGDADRIVICNLGLG